MRCGKEGMDTSQEVLNAYCLKYFYPTNEEKPCKLYDDCQAAMSEAVKNIPWCIEKHEEYIRSMNDGQGKDD